MIDDTVSQETSLGDRQEYAARQKMLRGALDSLNKRERHIFVERRLSEAPRTLEELSTQYGISRERVRQIEVRAFEKVQRAIKSASRDLAISSRQI